VVYLQVQAKIPVKKGDRFSLLAALKLNKQKQKKSGT
jgi:hypothetical protein